MPQVILEKSNNTKCIVSNKEILLKINKILNTTAGINLGNCKSRVITSNEYVVGDDSEEEAFVSLTLKFLEGRSKELKSKLGNELLALLEVNFSTENNPSRLQLTVEIADLLKENYFKHPSGTFTKQN